jgi:hypothetical protein
LCAGLIYLLVPNPEGNKSENKKKLFHIICNNVKKMFTPPFHLGVGGWGQGTYCCPPTSNPDRGSTASMFSCLAMHTPNIAISSKPRGVDWLNSHDSMPLPLLENNMSECLPLPHPSHLFYFIQ